MNAEGMFVRRKEEREHPRHGDARIWHPDENFLRRTKITTHDDGSGVTLLGGGEVRFLLGEGEIAGARAIGGREAGQFHRTVAEDFTPELFGNLRGSVRHSVMGWDGLSQGLNGWAN